MDDLVVGFAHLRGRIAAHEVILKALFLALGDELEDEILNILEGTEPDVPLEAFLELGPGISDVILKGYRNEVSLFRQAQERRRLSN